MRAVSRSKDALSRLKFFGLSAMSTTIGSPPDSFSLSPLLSLLPTCGSVARVEGMVSSLFARQEKVVQLREQGGSKELERRLACEEAMLRQVLDWLSAKSGGGE